MIGTLHKTEHGWVVRYTKDFDSDVVPYIGNDSIPLHQETFDPNTKQPIIPLEEDKEVEFELKYQWDVGMTKIIDVALIVNEVTEKKIHIKPKIPEYITCAAIWYKDLSDSRFKPKNINEGIVVCGHRHHNCIDIMASLGKLRSVKFAPDGVGESIQGFMTSKNRFVDRLEAAEIAISSGQVDRRLLDNPLIGLFSEDLY